MRLRLCGDLTGFYSLYMGVSSSLVSKYDERIDIRHFRGFLSSSLRYFFQLTNIIYWDFAEMGGAKASEGRNGADGKE